MTSATCCVDNWHGCCLIGGKRIVRKQYKFGRSRQLREQWGRLSYVSFVVVVVVAATVSGVLRVEVMLQRHNRVQSFTTRSRPMLHNLSR